MTYSLGEMHFVRQLEWACLPGCSCSSMVPQNAAAVLGFRCLRMPPRPGRCPHMMSMVPNLLHHAREPLGATLYNHRLQRHPHQIVTVGKAAFDIYYGWDCAMHHRYITASCSHWLCDRMLATGCNPA